jgi:hypothetical protein
MNLNVWSNLETMVNIDIGGIQSMKKYTMPDNEFYTNIKEILSPVVTGKNVSNENENCYKDL